METGTHITNRLGIPPQNRAKDARIRRSRDNGAKSAPDAGKCLAKDREGHSTNPDDPQNHTFPSNPTR